jgi:hypothetical protein
MDKPFSMLTLFSFFAWVVHTQGAPRGRAQKRTSALS